MQVPRGGTARVGFTDYLLKFWPDLVRTEDLGTRLYRPWNGSVNVRHPLYLFSYSNNKKS